MDDLQQMVVQRDLTNFVPMARALLRETQARLAARDAQVAELMAACAQDRSLIAGLKVVLAPVRELPAELLVSIFSEVVHAKNGGGLLAVLQLSQVCAHWRHLIHHTPALWTVELPIRPKDTPEYLSLLRIFIERSSPLAIPIRIDTNRGTRASSNRFPTALIKALLDAAGRWGSFSIVDAPEILSMLSKQPGQRLALLKSVFLWNSANQLWAQCGNFFLDAPVLVAANLNLAHSEKPVMPWAQLTQLTISQPDDPLSILALCTKLTRLVLTFKGFESSRVGPAVPAVLPNLQFFTLNSDIGDWHASAHVLSPLFARLTLPALKYLRIVTPVATARTVLS